jgi:hypothetical protein
MMKKIILGTSSYLRGSEGYDDLAWSAPAPSNRPTRVEGQWLALHPDLGTAILAVKAIALANEFGLDIVTDSPFVHQTVVSKREDDVFDELIGKPAVDHELSLDDTVDDLAEIVMATNFDLSKLSAKQIADLLADGKDLRRFKNELLSVAASIPSIKNVDERQNRLRAASEEVVEKWNEYRKSLPKFALDALVEITEVKWPDVVGKLLLSSSAVLIKGGRGLGILLVTYAGLKVFRKYQESVRSPYAYLNRIAKAQHQRQSFFSFPTNTLI